MVLYPVVPKGVIMLRIIPTAAHTMEHVNRTIEVFKEIKKKLDAGPIISCNCTIASCNVSGNDV